MKIKHLPRNTEEKISFIAVRKPEHIEWLRRQRNRPSLMRYFRQQKPITGREQKYWWKNLNKKNAALFIISVENKWIGYVGLNPIDWRHKHAEFGIFIVPEAQSGGYGGRALRFLLRYGFGKLGLHKIYSDVIDYPKENRFKFYRRLGFKKEGVLREHYKKGGRWFNSIQFSMLRRDFKPGTRRYLRYHLSKK